ncbi:ESX secretion-associated protein EspG [Actinophytocola sp. NPDC049390]|uniref:ESX secretion-associated protein EspG n=1 Tax=Actinophytocola sp. NPDC049390 TaxID=3363894 RepID=UPI003788E154
MTDDPVGRAVTLSLLEYDILWEHLRLGSFPPILDIDSHGATIAEREELRATAWASLAAKGLGSPRAPDERVTGLLNRVARPEWELDARLHLTSGPRTSALFAWHHRWATVAVLDGRGLTLDAVRADQVAPTAVSLLPLHPPGTGRSVTLPAAVLDKAARARDLARSLAAHGLGKDEARKIVDAWRDIVHFGQFGAARTPAGAARARAPHVVSVYDGAQRYLFTRKRDWVTLTPGTDAALTRQLDDMLSALSAETKARQ